jgi:hypothetical protein
MTRSLLAISFLLCGLLAGELFHGFVSRAVAPALLVLGVLGLSSESLRRAAPPPTQR